MNKTVPNPPQKKSTLTPGQIRLLELMQSISFGRIHDLVIRSREPTFDPPPRVLREIKFGSESGPRNELSHTDFLLKEQVREMFHRIHVLNHGIIKELEIKHGLPFRMTIEEPFAG